MVGTLLILGALMAIGPLSGDTYLPALPEIARHFGAQPVEVQLTLTTSLLGLGLGQLVIGPMSDVWGRRRPLLIGMGVYTIASLVCALSPTLPVLVTLRFLQGFSGAAAVVLTRAIVRDLYSGPAAVRAFSQLMLVFSVAPIAAPLLGSAVLGFTNWRGIFVLLAALGAVLFVVVFAKLDETLPAERRSSGGVRRTLAAAGGLVRDRAYVAYALSCGLAFAGMFAYIGGSPFVVQVLHGATPAAYAALFAANAGGIAVVSQINARLASTISPQRLLGIGIVIHVTGGLSVLAVVSLGDHLGLVPLVPALFVMVASVGLVLPNATALALARFPDRAGAASSLMGTLHFTLGACVVPLVGLGGSDTALGFGLVIAATASAAALTLFVLLRSAHRRLWQDERADT